MHSFCFSWCISDPNVAWVRYPGLPSDPQHHKSQKYLKGTGKWKYKAFCNHKMSALNIDVVTITPIQFAGGPMVVFGIKSANAKETGWVHFGVHIASKIPLALASAVNLLKTNVVQCYLGKSLSITWSSFRTLLMSETLGLLLFTLRLLHIVS